MTGVLELENVKVHGEQPTLDANDAPAVTDTVCTVTV